ncbi:hypothetical protein SNEBB_010973 [Seison nebaliae]|nr:hypothetical protein SNEBB_010973 [Seison nebaliae]
MTKTKTKDKSNEIYIIDFSNDYLLHSSGLLIQTMDDKFVKENNGAEFFSDPNNIVTCFIPPEANVNPVHFQCQLTPNGINSICSNGPNKYFMTKNIPFGMYNDDSRTTPNDPNFISLLDNIEYTYGLGSGLTYYMDEQYVFHNMVLFPINKIQTFMITNPSVPVTIFSRYATDMPRNELVHSIIMLPQLRLRQLEGIIGDREIFCLNIIRSVPRIRYIAFTRNCDYKISLFFGLTFVHLKPNFTVCCYNLSYDEPEFSMDKFNKFLYAFENSLRNDLANY